MLKRTMQWRNTKTKTEEETCSNMSSVAYLNEVNHEGHRKTKTKLIVKTKTKTSTQKAESGEEKRKQRREEEKLT
ncbi:hypothetical protein ACLB2K_013941 [Fragaria x ananassa]